MIGRTFCPESHECPRAQSCLAYGNCSKREQVITRSTHEWDNPDTKKRVIVYAKGMEKRLQRQHYGDHPMIGHRYESLIQQVWIKLLEGLPPRSLDIPLLNYFVERLNAERNRIRRRVENTSVTNTPRSSKVLTSQYATDDDGVSDLNLYRTQRTDYLQMRELQDLYDQIVARSPKLKDLLDLYMEFGTLPAKEQAQILNTNERRIYYLRSKLEESTLFCRTAIEEDEL